MNLFKTVERCTGENLGSAILRYLLLRSMPVRTALLNLLSDASPCGPIYAEDQFAVFLEVSTSAQDEEAQDETKGRVDMLLECDGAVIGLENKFNAGFQDNQPAKYLHTVKSRAQQLSRSRGSSPDTMRPILFVMAPKQRGEYVNQRIREQDTQTCCAFVAWQDVLAKLEKCVGDDPVSEFLVRELCDYVREHIDFPPDIGRLLPHLERPFTPKGTDLHVHMIDLLWPVFSAQLRETYFRGRGSSYCGYYFGPVSHPKQCWYGFINRRTVGGGDREGSAFIVATVVAEIDVKGMRSVEVQGWSDWNWRCWEVPYEKVWVARARWEKEIEPFNHAVALACQN